MSDSRFRIGVVGVEEVAAKLSAIRATWAIATWTQIVAHQRRRLAGLAAEWRAIARRMGVVVVDSTCN